MCLRSGDPEYQADGAMLLAVLADENARNTQDVLYDLTAVLDADVLGSRQSGCVATML